MRTECDRSVVRIHGVAAWPGTPGAVRMGPSATCDIFVPSSRGESPFESVEAEVQR